MNRKRTALVVLVGLGLLVGAAVIAVLTPPTSWRKIRIGMPRDEVERLVQFNYAPTERSLGMTYEYGKYFTWSLGVAWKAESTVRISKELWIHWPPEAPTMILHYLDEKK